MNAGVDLTAAAAFELPQELIATEPPEQRGLGRDDVRLLVAQPEKIMHASFRDLGAFLRPGDLVVVNNSATIRAALPAQRGDGSVVTLHLSNPIDQITWSVELRSADGSMSVRDASVGERLTLPEGATATLIAPASIRPRSGHRLWRTRFDVQAPLESYLVANARPISYGYVRKPLPLAAYQTIFARDAGSVEMPSAGRPLTGSLVAQLISAGVVLAPITLHTGVSSLQAGEPPEPERFEVSSATARLVNQTRASGGFVVAIGTTVVRALESATDVAGHVEPHSGWTDLILGPERPTRSVDALLTGWHSPDASHLMLLEAVAGPALVHAAYEEALAHRYLWHEFGDSCLFLPHASERLREVA